MQNFLSKKSILVIVTLVVLAGLVGLFVFYKLRDQKPIEQLKPLETKTKHLKEAENPRGIPANLPMTPGGSIKENYESTTNDGRLQSTQTFTTNLSPEEAIKKYITFFKGLGWKVAGADDKSPITMIRDNDSLLMVVNQPVDESPEENQAHFVEPSGTVVKITVIQFKK